MEIPIINLEIRIGDNQTAILKINQDEDIELKLNEFCKKYKIDTEIKRILMDKILDRIKKENESIYEEEEEENDSSHDKNDISAADITNYQESYIKEKSVAYKTYSAEPVKRKNSDEKPSLYERFKNKIEDKKEHIIHVIERQKQEEMREATFHPKISDNSIRLTEFLSNSRVEERLLNYGKDIKERVLKKQTNKNIKENDFPFRPSINNKSKILSSKASKKREVEIERFTMKDNYKTEVVKTESNDLNDKLDTVSFNDGPFNINKSNLNTSSKYTFSNMKAPSSKLTTYGSFIKLDEKDNILTNVDLSIRTDSSRSKSKKKCKKKTIKNKPIHEVLYKEVALKNDKKKKLEKEYMNKICPFNPNIADSVKIINREENKEEFIKRLLSSKKLNEQIIVSLKKKQEKEDCSKSTIKSRSSVKLKTKNEKKDHLESFYDQKLIEGKLKVQNEELLNNLEKKKQWLESSMKTVLRVKIEKYKEIFDLLDGDNDGYISSKKIKLSDIPLKILETLTPFLNELQSKNIAMNFKEFCINADKLMNKMIFSSKR